MITVLLIVLGLCFGSFVNALVWRIHQQSLPKKKRVANDRELSVSKGRSMCPYCQHTLTWYDLLPVFSWLGLRGKCRYCHKPISWQYPLVELLMTGLFLTSYIFWPTQLVSAASITEFGVWLVALVGLVALIIYDLKWMLLPNRIVFPLIGLAAAGTIIQTALSNNPASTILNAVGGLCIAGGLFYVLFQISGGRWIGGGDVKLGFALGLLLGGPVAAFLMLFVASIGGLVVSLPLVLWGRHKLSSQVPFGPFLIVATIVTKLFGASIIAWYTHQFLYF